MLRTLYFSAKIATAFITAFLSGTSYLAVEKIADETTLIPLGAAVMVAFFIGHLAFKWGARLARLEDRIAVLEGKRDGNGAKRL